MLHKNPKLKILAPLFIDVVSPIIIYYVLHACHVHDALALGIGALVPGTSTGGKLIKDRKLDQFGLFVTIMLLLGVVLVFITDNPRLILIKPALFVGLAGIFCFASLLSKPFMMTIAKPMATEGDVQLEKLWEKSWHDSREFQKVISVSIIVFGAALLIDAIGRIVIVYSMPVGKSVAVANLPGTIAIAAAIVFHLKTVKPVFEALKSR